MKTRPKSILNDVGCLVDGWLGPFSRGNQPRYRHRSAANQLSKRSSIPSSSDFLQIAYEQIDDNWRKAKAAGCSRASEENWRFSKQIHRSSKNKSAEVCLERDIIQAADERWANQIPTSSGLVGSASDKRQCIDLAFRSDNNHFSLIELKVECNNPLYAALEILQYGLLLAWSRNNQSELSYTPSKQPVLQANSVDLVVLAPAEYYEGANLSNLSDSINDGLAACQHTLQLPCTFQFTKFSADLCTTDTPQQLLDKTTKRIAIW